MVSILQTRSLGPSYADVCRDELSYIEWCFYECTHAVEQDNDDACNHTIACLQPLSMGLVRIRRIVSVVAGGLRLGGVAICLSIVKAACHGE